MPELGTSGTVGAAGGQSPAATQQNEVDDPALHDAYLDVWHALARLQPYGRR